MKIIRINIFLIALITFFITPFYTYGQEKFNADERQIDKSSLSCESIIKWFDVVNNNYSDNALYSLRKGRHGSDILVHNILSDKYFKPFVGISYDKLNENQRNTIRSKINKCYKKKKYQRSMVNIEKFTREVFDDNDAILDAKKVVAEIREINKTYNSIVEQAKDTITKSLSDDFSDLKYELMKYGYGNHRRILFTHDRNYMYDKLKSLSSKFALFDLSLEIKQRLRNKDPYRSIHSMRTFHLSSTHSRNMKSLNTNDKKQFDEEFEKYKSITINNAALYYLKDIDLKGKVFSKTDYSISNVYEVNKEISLHKELFRDVNFNKFPNVKKLYNELVTKKTYVLGMSDDFSKKVISINKLSNLNTLEKDLFIDTKEEGEFMKEMKSIVDEQRIFINAENERKIAKIISNPSNEILPIGEVEFYKFGKNSEIFVDEKKYFKDIFYGNFNDLDPRKVNKKVFGKHGDHFPDFHNLFLYFVYEKYGNAYYPNMTSHSFGITHSKSQYGLEVSSYTVDYEVYIPKGFKVKFESYINTNQWYIVNNYHFKDLIKTFLNRYKPDSLAFKQMMHNIYRFSNGLEAVKKQSDLKDTFE